MQTHITMHASFYLLHVHLTPIMQCLLEARSCLALGTLAVMLYTLTMFNNFIIESLIKGFIPLKIRL